MASAVPNESVALRLEGETSSRIRGHHKRNVLLSLAVFAFAFAIVYFPQFFDSPIEITINRLADRSVEFDWLLFSIYSHFTFTGVFLMSLIWSCWFGTVDREKRARILTGTLAAFGAGVISRSLQHLLPTHPRPFYDPSIAFHVPSVFGNTPLNTWNSFPSDHATVFFGLVATIYVARRRLGLLALAWIVCAEFAPAYMGGHYPSDLIGGGALGFALVWCAQAEPVRNAGARIAAWEHSSPSIFYMLAFFVSYQIATLFEEIRNAAGGVALLRLVGDLILK